MKEGDIKYFGLLKMRVVYTMKLTYPGIPDDISMWKGQDIVNFQEDLMLKVNENISEKWFYTHMKSDEGKLPRVDVLNFLSRYAGYRDWNDFRNDLAGEILEKKGWSFVYSDSYLVFAATTLLLISLIFIFAKTVGNRNYVISFADAYTKRKIVDSLTEIIILKENQSPVHTGVDNRGEFGFNTRDKTVSFIVKLPYYHTDTITRVLDRYEFKEKILLSPNDYALMISYFSVNNVIDWSSRKRHLNRMISDSAFIVHVDDLGRAVELYGKQEFIDKLTMPTSSLKDLEILETIYESKKISLMRFRQKGIEE